MYYDYHSRIRQRINAGELTGFEIVERYKNITPCLLLYFETEPRVRPIRGHRFEEYDFLFESKDTDI